MIIYRMSQEMEEIDLLDENEWIRNNYEWNTNDSKGRKSKVN